MPSTTPRNREERRAAERGDPSSGHRRLLYPANEALQLLGIGHTRFYEEMHAGRIATVKVGRRRMVTAAAIDAYLAALEADQAATA